MISLPKTEKLSLADDIPEFDMKADSAKTTEAQLLEQTLEVVGISRAEKNQFLTLLHIHELIKYIIQQTCEKVPFAGKENFVLFAEIQQHSPFYKTAQRLVDYVVQRGHMRFILTVCNTLLDEFQRIFAAGFEELRCHQELTSWFPLLFKKYLLNIRSMLYAYKALFGSRPAIFQESLTFLLGHYTFVIQHQDFDFNFVNSECSELIIGFLSFMPDPKQLIFPTKSDKELLQTLADIENQLRQHIDKLDEASLDIMVSLKKQPKNLLLSSVEELSVMQAVEVIFTKIPAKIDSLEKKHYQECMESWIIFYSITVEKLMYMLNHIKKFTKRSHVPQERLQAELQYSHKCSFCIDTSLCSIQAIRAALNRRTTSLELKHQTGVHLSKIVTTSVGIYANLIATISSPDGSSFHAKYTYANIILLFLEEIIQICINSSNTSFKNLMLCRMHRAWKVCIDGVAFDESPVLVVQDASRLVDVLQDGIAEQKERYEQIKKRFTKDDDLVRRKKEHAREVYKKWVLSFGAEETSESPKKSPPSEKRRKKRQSPMPVPAKEPPPSIEAITKEYVEGFQSRVSGILPTPPFVECQWENRRAILQKHWDNLQKDLPKCKKGTDIEMHAYWVRHMNALYQQQLQLLSSSIDRACQARSVNWGNIWKDKETLGSLYKKIFSFLETECQSYHKILLEDIQKISKAKLKEINTEFQYCCRITAENHARFLETTEGKIIPAFLKDLDNAMQQLQEIKRSLDSLDMSSPDFSFASKQLSYLKQKVSEYDKYYTEKTSILEKIPEEHKKKLEGSLKSIESAIEEAKKAIHGVLQRSQEERIFLQRQGKLPAHVERSGPSKFTLLRQELIDTRDAIDTAQKSLSLQKACTTAVFTLPVDQNFRFDKLQQDYTLPESIVSALTRLSNRNTLEKKPFLSSDKSASPASAKAGDALEIERDLREVELYIQHNMS